MNENKPKKRRYLRSRITQNLILDAAREVFLDYGYDKTTITEVSKRARVGYGTVYSHFQGKDDILIKVTDQVMEDFYDILNIELEINTIDDTIAAFERKILAAFRLAEANKKLFAVLHKSLSHSEEVMCHWNSILQKFISRVSKNLQNSRDKGFIRSSADLEVAAKTLTLIIERYLWEITYKENIDLEHLTTKLTGMFLFGLCDQEVSIETRA